MKEKISITIDKGTLSAVETELADGLFRNKSHLIEYAVNKFLRNNGDG